MAKKAFSLLGAKLYNSLERETKLAPSLRIFKRTTIEGVRTLTSFLLSFIDLVLYFIIIRFINVLLCS